MISKGFTAPLHSLNKKGNSSFFREILDLRIKQHQEALNNELSFFDRGIPDSLAFFKYMDIAAPSALIKSIEEYRYYEKVIMLPPWEEIFHKDEIRKENFRDSILLYELTKEAYMKSGYDIWELPEDSIEGRISYLLQLLSTRNLIEL